jgi:hypothetical protein
MSITFDQIDALRDSFAGLQFDPETLKPSEQDLRRFTESMKKTLIANPLLRKYVHEQQRAFNWGRAFRNTHAWHALAERNQVQLTLLVNGYARVGCMFQAMSAEETNLLLCMRLQMAAAYLWRLDVVRMANQMPIPRHVIARDQMQHPMMFFSFEGGLELINEGMEGQQSNWMYLGDEGDVISVLSDIMPLSSRTTPTQPGEPFLSLSQIPYGKTYPDDFAEEHLKSVGQTLAWLAFINSPYVDSAPHRFERQMRRELRGAPAEITEQEVSVITLRREIPRKQKPSDGPGEDIDYKNRWWVSGHIRAQWYPSLEAHKLIWVAPYLKGPDGMPIKERVYDVNR